MKNYIWHLIARVCVIPWVRTLIIRTAHRTPYMHLGGYMHRWWLMPRWMLTPDENGYLIPKRWVPFAIRVHHILRHDKDLVLHDHPWCWRTIILEGGYVEENVLGELNIYATGTTRHATAETFHRIDRVSQGGVWTLFITGRRTNKWGFMVGSPPRKMYWRKYESPNGRGE